MSIKNTVEKLKSLETEKLSLLAEVEELKKLADSKADNLADEIATLREEIRSLKVLMGSEKPQVTSKENLREKNLAATKELIEKTINASNQLGSQVFTTSPFSQSFDGWLTNLRQVISDFESNTIINVDKRLIDDCSLVLLNVEQGLSQKKVEEAKVSSVGKALADSDSRLVQMDKEYAQKTKELDLKRNVETQRLSNHVRELELQVQNQEEDNNKRKILKKKTDDKIPQARLELKSAKAELELAQQNCASEQAKLKDTYERKKQDVMEQIEVFRKELGELEIDSSLEVRQEACKALTDALNALYQRASAIA